MTYPYPPDGRCWTCNRVRPLTWLQRAADAGRVVGSWLCRKCRKEAA